MELSELLGDLADDVQFCGVQAHGPDYAVVLAVLKSLEEKQSEHAILLISRDGDWSQQLIPVSICSFCILDRELLFGVTPAGLLVRVDSGGYEGQSIDPSGRGFNRLRAATEIITRNKQFYVSGMGRELFAGGFDGGWKRLSENLSVSQESFVGGFLSCDLSDDGDVHAAGFGGEIWVFTQGRWTQAPSPTNQRITRIRNVGNGLFRACGANGVLIQGAGEAWSVIDQDLTSSTFWDLATFAGTTYASTSKMLLSIDPEADVQEVGYPSAEGISTGYLSATEERLWVVGPRNIACFDGQRWTTIW